MKPNSPYQPPLPLGYALCTALTLAATVAIGLWQTPLDRYAASHGMAALLRTLVTITMPLALAALSGASPSSQRAWGAALSAIAALTFTGSIGLTVLLSLLVALLLRPALRTPAAEAAPRRHAHWLVASACVLLTALLRLSVLDEPFERDIMVYAMVASGWLDGLQLYAGIWDHKPPALYVAYAAAITVFGQEPIAIWALGMAAFTLTLLGVKRVAERLSGPRAGLIAMAIWAVCGNDLLLQANQPNVEVFLNACLVWALSFLLPRDGTGLSARTILIAGGLFFLASSFKQIAVFPALFVAMWLVLQALRAAPPPNPAHRLARGTAQAALLGLPGAMGWSLLFLGFYTAGTLGDFLYAAFEYNQSYSGSLFGNIGAALLSGTNHPYFIGAFFVLVWLHALADKNESHSVLIAFYLGIAVMVAAPGKGFPHYFQLMVPPIAISGGAFLARAIPTEKLTAACLMVLAPIWVSFGYFTSPERVAFVKYGQSSHGGESLESREIGLWLSENSKENVRVLHWGAEPGVYFWSKRPTNYHHVFNYPLFDGPRAQEMTDAFLQQIICRPPELVVFSKKQDRMGGPIEAFLESHYSPAATAPRYEFFEIWEKTSTPPACGRAG
ncbi:glycosyltransferase family 39 protein [Salipiger sp. PrR002]|uniref:ArnT family glycosyltransferase n=1 Tax=Salipiger sp. PrR002 TaxID=2706489 RepID=UPI0013B79352|nr:hypothetical protein [Salipiger sp. PrR002]NDW02422.1 hypothetical protein [Salipiger sp. PrR002]NDW59557.1 hypothetical protein [Salipiger sp. PrR004]